MKLYSNYISISFDSLMCGRNITFESLSLSSINSLRLSNIKKFYYYKTRKRYKTIESSSELMKVDFNQNLAINVLYLLNFKKKFCSKNLNRIINNYFRIFLLYINKDIEAESVLGLKINDKFYLNTFNLTNLYIIAKINGN